MMQSHEDDLAHIRRHLHVLSPTGRAKAELLFDLCRRLDDLERSPATPDQTAERGRQQH